MNSFHIGRASLDVLLRAWLAFIISVTFVVVPGFAPAVAVNVGLYELDGDVIDDTTPGVDAVNVRSGTSGALATTVVSDPVNAKTDIMFQSGGGSSTAKDTGDVSDWRWTNKEPGDKLDLIDVLASQWVDPISGDPFVYIGATRYDGSGASTLGFWFLQDPVELGSGGRFNSIETGNPGTHVDGDVLIVADFGGTNVLDIYRWTAGAPVLESTTTLSCLSATATTPACGVSNPSAISSPWPIVQKGYPSNQIGPDAFVELGVNLESTLGNNLGCYQSIIATSRTSDSLTATLNDLALAGVSTCAVSIDKTGPASAAAGETVTYDFVITNDGVTPLTLDSVTDDVIGDLASQATAAGCGSLRGGESCSFSVGSTVPAGQAAGPLVNTVTADFEPPNGRTTATASDTHTTQVYRPAVSITKTADLDPANVGEAVTYTYVITNATEDAPATASPAMSITSVTDDLLGSISTLSCGALATGASCTLTATDVPDGTNDPLVNQVDVNASWGSVSRTATATESIDVNRSPAAVDDSYATDEDTVLTVAAPGILTNDSDPDGDTLSVQPVTDTIPGDLAVSANGALTYDPAGAFESLASGESTTVSFEYTATDPGGLTSTATVEITITGVNDPVDANPDSYTVDEGQTLTVPADGVLANDTDPDTSDVLNVVAFDSTSTGGGTVAVAANGSFTYTPAGGFTGTDTFTYTVSDGNGSSVTETVTITVSPAPDVVITDATIVEGGGLVFDVSLSRAFSAAIDVTFATSGGSATVGDDFTATTVTVSFGPGDTSATVTVPTTDDSIDEPDETLTLSVTSSSTPIGDTSDTGTGTILDDDAAPVVSISDASASEGDDLTFTVTLSNPSSEAITVNLTSTDVEAAAGSDYAAGPYSVTIAAGDTSGTVTVGSIDDTIDEPSETFAISVSSTTGGSVGDTSDTGTGTIIDDDPAPSVTIGDTSVTEGGDLSFAVSLSNPSSTAIVLTLTTTGVTATAADDYDGSAVTVTFLPGETSATAVVPTFDDVIDEPDETLTVGVGFVTGTVGDTSGTGTGTILDDDAAPDVLVGDVSVTEGGDLVFDVTLTNPSSGTITVDLSTADITATAGDDYTATTGTVTYVPGDTAETFTVSTTVDLVDEPDETLTVAVTGSTGTVGDTSDTGTGTILDDDATPDVLIGDVSVTEGGDLVFDVTLTGVSASTITVDLATADGTATAGVDYTATTGTVTFVPGDSAETFTVPTTSDAIDEPDETLSVSVTGSTGTVGDTSDVGTGTILDDDAAPDIVIGDVSVAEGGDLVFSVGLTSPSSSTISVDLATADITAMAGVDYTSTTGTVTFVPGDTAETFTVPTTVDLVDEPDETLTVSVTSSTGTVGDTSGIGTGTILDDDAAPDVLVGDVSVTEGGDLVFDVTLTNPSSGTITVDLSTADITATAGDDYTATTGTVTYVPGDTAETFTVSTTVDLVDEPDETLTVAVTGSTGTVGDTSDTGTGTILDDDATPDVLIGDVSVTEGGDLVFDVTLTGVSASTITVDLATADGTATAGVDYTATTGTVTFVPGDATETFTVSTTVDALDEPDESLSVSVTGSTGTVGDTSDTGTGTILDDDATPDVVIGDVSVTEGGDLVFDVTLTAASGGTITVDLATADGTAGAGDDYTATTGTVTFVPGDTAETFTVSTLDDTIDEPDETLTVSVTGATGTVGDTSDSGTGTILDDDVAPEVVVGDVSVTEGGDLVFDVTLTNPSSSTIAVDLSTADGTATAGDDYTATTGTVTFVPGDTVETFTVTTTSDAIDESDETLTVSVTSSTGTVGDISDTGTGTILDDDATPDVVIGDASVTEGGDLVFDVTLTGVSASTITVDLATADGTATAGVDYTSTTGTVTFVPGDTVETFTTPTTVDLIDESDETLTVSVTNSTGTVGDTSDTGTGTILDDDAAPTVTIDDASTAEGSDLVFDISLSNPSSGDIELTVAASDVTATSGADFAAGPYTVAIPAGVATATLILSTVEDTIDEPDETFTLSITASTGAVGDTSDTATGTILDDDAAPDVVVGDVSVTEGGDLVFDVTLTNPSSSTITVDLSTADGTATAADDYAATTGTIEFVPGDTAETFTVSTTSDTIDEPDETLTVAVTSSTGTVGDTSDIGTGTILDDDSAPGVVVGDVSVTEGGDLVFDVTLTGASASTITVDLTTADGTAVAGDDYTATNGTITFLPSDTAETFTVPTTSDTIDESDETLTVSVTGSTGSVGDTSDIGLGTILDDDDAPDVVIGDVSISEGGDLVFDITLSSPSSTTITVDLATADGTASAGDDYTATSGTVTFVPGDTAETFIVPTTSDAIDEPDETLTAFVVGSTGTVGDTSDTGTGTILDDDDAPDVVIGDVSVTEGGDLVFDVSLTGPSSTTITLDLTTADGTATAGDDYTSTAATVTFAAGETASSVTVGTLDDAIAEPDETLTVSVAAATGTVGDTSDSGTGTILDDEGVPSVIVGDASITEGGDLEFTVSLTGAAGSVITLDVATSDGTAAAGADYTGVTTTIVFAPGATSATVTVPTIADAVDEPDETLTLSITGSTGTVGDTTDTGTGTILDDDPAPDVTIDDASATEGTDIQVTVSLSNPSASEITVTIGTADGTAIAGADYTAGPYSVTFSAGTTVATFNLPTADDLFDESDETIALSITATTGIVGDTSDTAVATILDDDGPPTVTISDATVTEGGDLVFDVTLSNPAATDIPVTLTTADQTAGAPDDYTATSTTLTFTAGDTAAMFTVPTVADTTAEPDETLTVSITSSTGPVGDTSDTATGTILDNDSAPGVSISDPTVVEGGDLVFDVTLSNPSSVTITLDLATADGTAAAGSDYSATSATVSFAPGATAGTFTVLTIADGLDEPDETLTASVTGSTGPVGDTTDTGTGTITDDDATPDVVIGDASIGEGGDLVFDVTLTAPSSGTITVTVGTSDGTAIAPGDYTATATTITFNPGDTLATVTVPTATDTLAEADETITLAVTGSTGTLGDVSDTGTGTITDDDAPDLTITDTTINEGGDLLFTVQINTTSSVDTVVTLTTSDGTATAGADYTSTTSQVTIAAGDTGTTFTVPTTVDLIDEPDETLTVSVASVDAGFVADSTDTGTGTITDDDAAPTVTIADTTTTEGDDATFTVSLSNPSASDIVLEITPTTGTAGAGDVDLTPVTVTIPAGSTSITFDVPTIGDTIDEPDETFDVAITGVAAGSVGDTSDTATGTITDDDAVPTAVVSDASATEGGDLDFSVTLSNASSTDITLSVATSDATAVSGGDYVATTTTVTIPAGSTTAIVAVGTVEDALAEPAETMSLAITGVVAGTVVDPTGETGIGTITDDDAPSVVISDASTTEGDSTEFTVTLSNPSTTDTVLVLQPTNGSASGGSDFDAAPTTVTIQAGDTAATVFVPTVEDGVAEPTETFTLAVSTVTSGIIGDTSDTGTGTITDDDAPDLLIDDVIAAEGDALVFTVTLSNPSYETIQVDLTPTGVTATGGADYAAGAVTATFAPGDTSATATVAGIQDTVDESDETFTLAVTSSTGNLGDTSDTGTGTITDDDGPPSMTIGDATSLEGGDLSFPVTLSNPSSEDITIVISLTDVTATAGDDYAAGTLSVTIPAGDTTGTAIVSTFDDTLDEPTETLTAAIASTSGGAVGDISDTAVGSITDNDAAPSVTIGDASAIEGGDLVFDVTLSNPSAQAITVTVITTDGTATDGADYTGGSFDVTFAAGETTGTVTVGTLDDAVDEPDETFTVSVDSTSGGAVGDTSDVGTGTITDDDLPVAPNVSIGDASVTEGGDLVFPITLDIPAIDSIELQISTADGTATDGSDYTATTATVALSAGASSASFTVPTTDDADVEGNETLTATIDSLTGSAAIADGTATGTIIDDDAAVPDVVIGDVTVSEGDTATFTVSLTAPAIDEVTVTLTASDGTAASGTDYTATTVTVTIPAGATSATFDVPTIEDAVDEPGETFAVSIIASTGTLGDTSDVATGSIVDDDPAPSVSIDDVSVAEGDALVFDVTLSNPSSQSITVTFATADGTATGGVDYTGGTFDVTFAPGETVGSVTVPTIEDLDIEPDETLTLSVASTSGGAVGSTADVGTGTITDDDSAPAPDVTISDATVTEGGDLVFDITLSETTTEDIVLRLSTADGTALAGVDYVTSTVVVAIDAGDTTGTVTVPTNGDLIDEFDETLTLAVASVDAGPVGDTSDIGTGTIVDDDAAPSITLDDVAVIEGGDAVIPISLSNPSSEDITITLEIVGGTADDTDRPDITVAVTIPAGAPTATATFPTTADTVDEPDETFIVAVASVDSGSVGDTSDAGTATILDDDGVLGSITGQVWDDANSDVNIDTGEPDISGVTVELYQAGPDGTFGTSDDVLVDSTVTTGSYLFSDLYLGAYQVRVVTATLPAGYVATGDFDGGTDSVAIATVIDATPVTGVDFGYVDPNDPPTAVDDTATTVGGVTIDVLSNDSDPDGDPLSLDSVVQPANGTVVDNGDTTVTYTPDAGFVGVDTFTYTVCDPSGACDTATVTVTVNLSTRGGTPPAGNNPPDYETGFVPELTTLVGGSLGSLPLVDPDGDTVTVTIVSGAVPPGVTLQPDGTFTGTASVSGTFVLELELCDDGSPVACVLRPLTIIVDQVVGTTPVPPLPTPPDLETPAVEPPGPVDLDELPFTGLETHGLLALALALLGAGAVLLRVGRSEP